MSQRYLLPGLLATWISIPCFGIGHGASDQRLDVPAAVTPGLGGGTGEAAFLAAAGSESILTPRHDCRFPGEFEHQSALLLACHELVSTAPGLLVELVRATQGRIDIVALVANIEEFETVTGLLRRHGVSQHHLHFAEISHDTMWARDYGPIVVQSRAGWPIVIDADYDLARANDDRVPFQFAHLLKLPVVRVPLRLDGGNLLSNGDGLALTTYRTVDDNAAEADVDGMCDLIASGYGLRQVVILEPLAGEVTGHVDMFALFISKNTVVVGEFDPQVDAENAAILDRNADYLSRLQTSSGALQVFRLPMPAHDDGIWRTYTNVIFANGALLVPIYEDADVTEQRQALSTYTELLPRWQIIGVNASRIIGSNGALHCISMNLGPLGRLPEFPRPHTRAAAPPVFLELDPFGAPRARGVAITVQPWMNRFGN